VLNSSLTRYAKNYWSKVYGVNKSSLLLDVSEFDLAKGLIQDPMHLLFEGVTHMEIVLLLKYAIYEKRYFTVSLFSMLYSWHN
jgi:hypothetical protein